MHVNFLLSNPIMDTSVLSVAELFGETQQHRPKAKTSSSPKKAARESAKPVTNKSDIWDEQDIQPEDVFDPRPMPE
jgi:hypothetical protein